MNFFHLDISWLSAAGLFVAAMMGGAVNAVAGGGTLLTFPALLWAGQAEIIANATSTVALWPGSLSSFWGYRDEFKSSRGEICLLALPSLLGGILGALLLVNTSGETFARLVPYLILLATGLFALQQPLARWQARRAQADNPAAVPGKPAKFRWGMVLVFQLITGIYGGYFGAGAGIMMLAAFGFLGMTNIHHMNALKNLNAMCINGIAAAMFIAKGFVDWRLAIVMAAGAIVGGAAGAGTARRLGQNNVRRVIMLIGISLGAWLLVKKSLGV